MPEVPKPAGAVGAELRDITVLSSHDAWTVGAWWSITSRHG